MTNKAELISWVHFGDLHITGREAETYADFLDLIAEANKNLAGHVDFAYLPGDNADDGIPCQYQLVKEALKSLQLLVYVITGDHDRKAGTLQPFQEYLEPKLYRSLTLSNFHLLFLNAMDGTDSKAFDLSSAQLAWLQLELARARTSGLRPIVFVHLYPSELQTTGGELSRLLRDSGVEIVEMGHTHYNELANDGRIIYIATRSTGQIEEGPPGFSFTVIDGDAISWKFKQRGAWPFVMITSPADFRLVTNTASTTQIGRGTLKLRARVWGSDLSSVTCFIAGQKPEPMRLQADGFWQTEWDSRTVPDGPCLIRVEARTIDGRGASDEITSIVNQSGDYVLPVRHEIDYENTVGPWPEKGILGTQLGPNENGTKGPWPSWRTR